MKTVRVVFCLLLVGLFSMASCKKNVTPTPEPKGDETVFSYDDLYKTVYDKPFEEKERLTTKARYGYILNNKQGYNSWYYLYERNGQTLQMSYKSDRFVGVDSFMNQDIMHAQKGEKAIRQLLSGFDGEAIIYGNYRMEESSQSNANIKITVNGEEIYSTVLVKGDLIGRYFEVKQTLHQNDDIKFTVESDNCDVSFDPVVTLENNQNVSLYHLNGIGKQYGDVFPWYNEEEHKLYNWYLWSDDCMQGYEFAMDLSTNLLKMETYEEANNYDLFYKMYSNYFYQRIMDVNRFADPSLYSFGVRDNMVYLDKENKRYIMIAGCYRTFSGPIWDSDLMIYVSDDDMALSWTRPGNPVHLKYTANLPECPSLLKIGDRWYSFVSVSHITDHQIGPLQYWIGDKGVDCMDVDWLSKDFQFLDGEDLCAARPTQVGDKVYMWGWITSKCDGVPLSPWAGYLNLPREVVVRDDGSLGGRMDPGLAKYINYGNQYLLDEQIVNGDFVTLTGNNQRNFVTFDVDLSSCNEASYCIIQNGKLYKCSLIKESGKTYMQISSPDAAKHKVNSKIEIYHPSADDKYSVKIVIDGQFIEMFANEDNALTASTAMDSSPYTACLYSDSTAKFTNIMINRLRSYGDCD